MVDPNNIIKYDRTRAEKEELILFLICVAGKKASTVSRQLNQFLLAPHEPFLWVKMLIESGTLEQSLRMYRFGQYTKLTKAFTQIANSNLDLDTCTKEDLMKIHGIGRKSASCFLAWTREGEQVAMLDTHILKHLKHLQQVFPYYPKGHPEYNARGLRTMLHGVNIPKNTPSSKKLYDILEKAFLEYAKILHRNPTEVDLEIWKHYANGLDKQGENIII